MRSTRSLSLAALLVIGTACLSAGADHTVLEVTADDYTFDIAEAATMTPGRVTIRLVNDGDEEHQAPLARLNQGIREADVATALKDGDFPKLMSSVTWVGGPGGIAPGGEQVTEQILAAGTYLFICFLPAADGTPHFAKGMTTSFQITGAEPSDPKPVGSEATIEASDFAIELPQGFDGDGTFAVTNAGDQPHEAVILALGEDLSAKDVFAELEKGSSERITAAGGLGPIPEGGMAWMQLDLDPGRYAFICLVPDTDSGKAHAELGMVTGFTIA